MSWRVVNHRTRVQIEIGRWVFRCNGFRTKVRGHLIKFETLLELFGVSPRTFVNLHIVALFFGKFILTPERKTVVKEKRVFFCFDLAPC